MQGLIPGSRRRALQAALAIAALAGSLHAGEEAAAGEALTEAGARAIVLKAAAICRATPPPKALTDGEQGAYMKTIEPLLALGEEGLPALRALASSERVDAFEQRVAEILAARIEHPERFEMVTPFFTPVPLDTRWVRYAPWRGTHGLRLPRTLVWVKSLTPELMHPDDRRAVERFRASPAYLKREEVYRKYDELLAKSPPGDLEAGRDLWRRREEELKETEKALGEYFAFMDRVRPDPDCLLAWEEGAIRPVPWTMKKAFARFVMRTGEVRSAPTLGALLRQALASGADDLIREICEVLTRFPEPRVLVALGEALEAARDGEKKLLAQREIGTRVADSAPWRELLAEGEADPGLKKHVAQIHEAVTKCRDLQKEREKGEAWLIVHHAAMICERVLPPKAPQTREQGQYMETVRPLLAVGEKSLSALRALAASDKVNPLEKRVARILIARIEHPQEFEQVSKFYGVSPESYDALSRQLRPEREHLLVYEEAMIRPVPWRMKEVFTRITVQLGDSSSVPALQMVLGQVFRQKITDAADRECAEGMAREIVRALTAFPERAALLALSGALLYAQNDAKMRRAFQEIIGSAVTGSRGWQDLLAESESDRGLRKHVMRLMNAVQARRNRPPPPLE